jgi:hypothetical protein
MRYIIIFALAAAAICVPIVVLTHRALMLTPTELEQLDQLVKETSPPSSTISRLAAPDRIERNGAVKTGYFTYLISTAAGSRKIHVDWRVEQGRVQIVNVRD